MEDMIEPGMDVIRRATAISDKMLIEDGIPLRLIDQLRTNEQQIAQLEERVEELTAENAALKAMGKPSWNNAPGWANYLAMDRDGAWYWYEITPKVLEAVYSWDALQRYDFAEQYDNGWRQTLEQRP